MSGPYHYEQYQDRGNLPAPVAYVAPRLTDQQPISTPVVVIAWVTTALTGLYMLPWAIAASRGKSNQWSVFLVDLLLGWTLIGWIVALVMACTSHQPMYAVPMLGYAAVPARPAVTAPAGWYPSPDGPGMRYWDGYQWTPHYS